MGDFAHTHTQGRGRDTSYGAAESVESEAKRLKARILSYMRGCGISKSSEEIADALDVRHDQAWRRVSDLANEGWLVDSGHRTRNVSGRPAILWSLVEDPIPRIPRAGRAKCESCAALEAEVARLRQLLDQQELAI
jgi:predicted ArsR family transcriptional regulator